MTRRDLGRGAARAAAAVARLWVLGDGVRGLGIVAALTLPIAALAAWRPRPGRRIGRAGAAAARRCAACSRARCAGARRMRCCAPRASRSSRARSPGCSCTTTLDGRGAATLASAAIAIVLVASQVGVRLVLLDAHRASAWLAATTGISEPARITALGLAIGGVDLATAAIAVIAAAIAGRLDAETTAWLALAMLGAATTRRDRRHAHARARGRIADGRGARRHRRDRDRGDHRAVARRLRIHRHRRRARDQRRARGAKMSGVVAEPNMRVDKLAVRRGGRAIFDSFSLAAAAGELVGLVGANGCGKSTLLACVAGVLAPRDGHVRIAGARVWGPRRERQAARRALGYVPEAADPPPFLRASELWALCAAARGVNMPSEALIDRLGLEELRDSRSSACRSGSAGARAWAPRCSGRPRCSCSTSPITASTRAAPTRSKPCCAITPPRGAPR